MKIALVSNNISFITGGPRLLFNLAHYLREFGHEVVVYSTDTGGDHFKELTHGLRIETVTQGTSAKAQAPGFLGWILGKLERERNDILVAKKMAEVMDPDFDIVNVHDFSYRVGYFYKQRHSKAKVVWHENATLFVYMTRGKFLHDLAGRLYWCVKKLQDKKYFRAMDTMVVLDHYNKRRREEAGGHDVVVVRCGLDVEKFYAPVKDFHAKAARKEVQLLALGALNAYRRYDNVVEAVRMLREWGYDARAKIVAKNVWHEDQCREDLVALVKKYNLEPYLRFYFDGLPEPELVQAMRGADVFVQAVYSPPPSHHGWGIVNFEAIAAGVPVVVTRSATATEVLQDGETALFFEPLHPEQIAEKVKFLVDHPDAYQHIASAGQKYVRENQSWKRYAEEVLVVFRTSLARGK